MPEEQDHDVELGLPQHSPPSRLEGYPSFAEFIASDIDAAIYRKFTRLSARNLLYLQSELHQLEEQLQRLDRHEAEDIDDDEAQKAARQWDHYCNQDTRGAHQRRVLHDTIRSKIKEYRVYFSVPCGRQNWQSFDIKLTDEALLLESQILSLSPPSAPTLGACKRWFTSASTPVLWGRDQHLFGDGQDLIALAPVNTDRLDLFLQTYFGWLLGTRGHDGGGVSHKLYYYPSRRIQTAGAVLSILISAVLLVGAIVCLLLIADRSIHLRVGMIVLFTCLFALIVGLFTNARRAEIFGATAAYAAVLVVFVSNNLGDSHEA